MKFDSLLDFFLRVYGLWTLLGGLFILLFLYLVYPRLKRSYYLNLSISKLEKSLENARIISDQEGHVQPYNKSRYVRHVNFIEAIYEERVGHPPSKYNYIYD